MLRNRTNEDEARCARRDQTARRRQMATAIGALMLATFALADQTAAATNAAWHDDVRGPTRLTTATLLVRDQREQERSRAHLERMQLASDSLLLPDFAPQFPSMLTGLLALLVCAGSGLLLSPLSGARRKSGGSAGVQSG